MAPSCPQSASLARRWRRFIAERFALGVHLPMVFLFSLANGVVAARLLNAALDPWRLLASFLLMLSFFLRLRCFDEIKDFATDCRVNPDRPLARGLLRIAEVERMIVALIVFELLVATLLGGRVVATHGIAMIYSVFMYWEFFIGSWLSKHLTSYAVSHTFVSVLLGYAVAAQVSGFWLADFPAQLLVFSLVNWAMFNFFEFARKTFAPAEERENVETYSSRFSPSGAVLLSLSQVAFALFILLTLPDSLLQSGWFDLPGWSLHVAAALLPILAATVYIEWPTPRSAALFRKLNGTYLLVFYALLAGQALT